MMMMMMMTAKCVSGYNIRCKGGGQKKGARHWPGLNSLHRYLGITHYGTKILYLHDSPKGHQDLVDIINK